MRGLEDHPALLGGLGKGDAELEELEKDSREVLEPGLLILGVALDVLLEGLVGDEGHVGGEHHEGFGGLVFILFSG